MFSNAYYSEYHDDYSSYNNTEHYTNDYRSTVLWWFCKEK